MKKKILQIVTLWFVIFAISACSKVKDALDVSFDADYTVDIALVVPADGSKAAKANIFTGSETLDPLSNEEMARYANKIKDVEVKAITGVVTSITKPTTLLDGQLSVSSFGYPNAEWSFANVFLTEGAELVMGNQGGQIDALQNILRSKQVLTVTVSGTTEHDDLTFNLEVLIETVVTANPL